MTLLGRHAPAFSARNSYVDALLGVLAAAAWLDGWLTRHCSAGPSPGPHAAAGVANSEPVEGSSGALPEDAVLFLMGLVSMSRAARRVILEWVNAAPPVAERNEPPAEVEVRGWLR